MTAANVTKKQFADFFKEEIGHHERQEGDVREIKERMASAEESLERHSHALFGNGVIGMDEHIRNIWKWVSEQQDKEKLEAKEKLEDEKERKRARINLQNSLIILFISQVVTIAVSVWVRR